MPRVRSTESTEYTVSENGATPAAPPTHLVIGIRVPKAFYDLVEQRAKDSDPPTSVVALARQALAESFEYTLPAVVTRRKFANEAEKEASQKASAKQRRDAMSAALAALSSGAIKIVDGKVVFMAAEGTTLDIPEAKTRTAKPKVDAEAVTA